jgi:elongation factor P--(R)-beta-lysine ligase
VRHQRAAAKERVTGLEDPKLAEIARYRHRARKAARSFFEERGFQEVDTPSLVVCPGLDAHVHSLGRVEVLGEARYLITSPEFHMKRLLVAGLERIYQFAHCFRAEELGTWHEPEFLMLEWYRVGANFDALLEETEELVRRISLEVAPSGRLVRADSGHEADVRLPFLHLELGEAFRTYANVTDVRELAQDEPEQYFQILVDKIEPALASLGRPVFLKHYPISQAGLARAVPSAPGYAERFELYAAGIELCNGFGELTEPVEQRRRFEQELERRRGASEPTYPIDEEFLSALERGLPEAAGNALGFDRLLALCLGTLGLKGSVPFPLVARS